MIIGNGDVASVLKDRKGFIFFASGVSNSSETRESEFHREKKLLLSQDKNLHIVYFGSLSIFYNTNRYAKHKLEMEKILKDNFSKYTIVRLGNISWGTNPNTIINYFRNKIKNNEQFEVQDTYRYIIDKEEFLNWISMIPEWNCEMNLTGTMLSIKQIVEKYGYTKIHNRKV